MRHNFHSSLKPDVYTHSSHIVGKIQNGECFSYALVLNVEQIKESLHLYTKDTRKKEKKTESGPIPIPTKTKTCTETHKTHIPIHMPHSRVEYHAMPVASVVYCLIPTKHFQRINSMHLHNTKPH